MASPVYRKLLGVSVLAVALASGCTAQTQLPTAPKGTATSSPVTASPTAQSGDVDLARAYAHPEDGGLGAYFQAHPDQLPDEVDARTPLLAEASAGPHVFNVSEVPPRTKAIYMTIACASSSKYRLRLLYANEANAGSMWGDDCGEADGGISSYISPEFDSRGLPTHFKVTVAAGVHYSVVLYPVTAPESE